MSFLISCWFIIENVIIPDGYRKWFYLNFYIHPSILFFCQIFLWLKLLKDCLLALLFFPLRASYLPCLYIFLTFKNCAFCLCSIIRPNNRTQGRQEDAEQYLEARSSFVSDRTADLLVFASIATPLLFHVKLLGYEECQDTSKASQLYLCYDADAASANDEDSFSFTTESSTTDEKSDEFPHELGQRGHGVEYSPTDSTSNFELVEREAIGKEEEEEEFDELLKTYAERMRWFDILNQDRACGISAIESNQIGTPSPFRSIESCPRNKMTTRRLLRSLESDFEMVYVAQACLSWTALHHQYMKVKALESFSSQNGMFCSYLAGEFQKFHVVLERFMEHEQTEGKRVWNYVNGRFSLKGLLQVPNVSVKGLMKEEKENLKGEGTNIGGVLRVIEKCIEAFWLFVKTENTKKSRWQIKTSSWTYYPPVEDPRDLELLSHLTKTHQKIKIWLKDLEGKKRCLLKRIVNPLEEPQRKEMMFTKIDMKLVSRVLQMPMISSPQLKWCQEKLDNLEFKDGKVFRACTDSLFPP